MSAATSGSAEKAGQRLAYRVSPSRRIEGKILQFDSQKGKALTEIRLLFPTHALSWSSSVVMRWPSTHSFFRARLLSVTSMREPM